MRTRLVISAALLLAFATNADALNTSRVASGLSRPVLVTFAPQDMSRIFILEQRAGSVGRIRILRNGVLLSRAFLSVSPVATGSEQGLLGLAFHPDYSTNGLLYVNYTRGGDGATVVARYRVSTDPDSADAASAHILMIIPQPYSNHNGGMIAFGPDGYLYIGTGDGGSGNDPENRAQSDTTLLGKMLRIDVNSESGYVIPPTNPFAGPDGIRDEIWTKGWRNPWRWSFDRSTGDLYVGDVGQDQREEVDFEPAGIPGGGNYGWRCLEGTRCTGLSGCSCSDTTLIRPIFEYAHGGVPSRCSVTGGYVYRGCAIPELRGTYFFADYCSNQIWSFRYDGNDTSEYRDRTADLAPGGGLNIGSISSFGEDALGELYVCDLSGGEVFKVVPDTLNDCNGNGVADACDIVGGHSPDANGNGIPDECECENAEVTDLTCKSDGDDVVLHWNISGNGLETYRVFRSAAFDAPFPDPVWELVAANLTPAPGDSSMSYRDTGAVDLGEHIFYLVTSVCP